MRRLALAPLLLAGCFTETVVDALPCVTDEGCGADEYQCVFGYCRRAGTDPLANCGDGEATEGEYCYPADSRATFNAATSVIEGIEEYDADHDGDLDYMVSTTAQMQLLTTDARGPGNPMPINVTTTGERLLEVIPSLPAAVATVPVPVAEFGLGQLNADDRLEFVFELGDAELPMQIQQYEATLRRNLWLAESTGGNNYTARGIVLFEAAFLFIEPGGIIVEDFDADGDDDLLVLFSTEAMGQRRAMFFEASAVGELLAGVELATAGGRGTPMALDIDGDGAIEVVLPSLADGQVSVMDDALRGSPDSPPRLIEIPPNPRSIQIDDFDADGDLDLILAYGGSGEDGSVVLMTANGDLKYDTIEIPTVAATGAAVADVDQNGALDLIVATGEEVYVHAGFQDYEDWGVAVLVDETDIDTLRIFDWNKDGAPDWLTSKDRLIQSALADP